MRKKKWIEYYEDGKIKYEGEYLFGRRKNGKIKEYYISGNMQFKGIY